MIEPILIDTGAIFAAKSESDENHRRAREFLNSVLENNLFTFIASEFILFETVTLIKARVNPPAAIEAGKQLRNSNFIQVVDVSRDIITKAWAIFDQYDDKDFSFVDCTSFAIMRDHNIKKAFSFDKHFRQFGFQQLP